MTGVWVSDADSALGTRVLGRLAVIDGIDSVEAGTGEIAVYLGAADPDSRSRRRESITAGAAAMLDTVAAARHLVVVSSAMVYGAWDNNPVPITEDAVLRPGNEFAYASQVAAVEQLAEAWRQAAPGRTVTVLRPAVPMAANGTSGLARALAWGTGQRLAVDDPPAQFVHLDDLAAAVELGVVRCLDGVFNVAPDGFIPATSVRALSGVGPRLKLPDRFADLVASLRWRFQRGPIPPGLLGYTRAPWLVANDRLRGEGWAPTVTNEQAYVEGTDERWWTMITPKRRQELALGALVMGGLVAVLALARVMRWAQRHRAAR
jgi:nucleoside-diphosphate-sugar epimerase